MSQELIWPNHKSVMVMAVHFALHNQRLSDANKAVVVAAFTDRMDKLLERFKSYDAEAFPDLKPEEVELLDRLTREGRIMWRALKKEVKE